MNDKEKQIEEMSKIVDKVFRCYYKGDYESGIKDFATHLVEFGAMVLPEGSVVLTEEQFNEFQEDSAKVKFLKKEIRKQAVEELIQAITKDVDATYHTATSTYVDIDDIHHIAIDKFGVEL